MWTTERGLIFNTGPYGDPPLKIKILKIGLRSDLSWPKLGLEQNLHEPGTFGGFGKREQTNRQDSCFLSIYKGYVGDLSIAFRMTLYLFSNSVISLTRQHGIT